MNVSLLCALSCMFVGLGTQPEPIPVSNARQLFIDNRFIATAENVRLCVNPPRWAGRVVTNDKPWEKIGATAFLTVLEDGKQYRMYYCAIGDSFASTQMRTCLALSNDGLHWTKPNLGLFDFKGSKDNNVLPELDGTPFIDPTSPPDQRYRMLTLNYTGDIQLNQQGMFMISSPDGIHWSERKVRVSEYGPDTQNQVFYDTRLKKYVAYLRGWNPLRVVCRCEMEDVLAPFPFKAGPKPLRLWGEKRPPVPSTEIPTVIACDQQDPPDTDIYNPSIVQYPWAEDVYLAFPSLYRHFPEPPKGQYKNDGLLEVQLAVSRDGVQWTRPDRKPYVGLGTPSRRDAGQVYMGVGMIRVGDEIYQYYGGLDLSHTDADRKRDISNSGGIFLVVQRLDGFMSADAGYSGGTLTTPPITFTGKQLVLNIDCSALGETGVEILDAGGGPIAGFTRKDCETVMGNNTAHVVKFAGKDDLSSLAGKPVRLRLIMRATKLYAFQFVNPDGPE